MILEIPTNSLNTTWQLINRTFLELTHCFKHMYMYISHCIVRCINHCTEWVFCYHMFTADNNEVLKVGTSLVGKFAISATFTIMFVYSAELFSTDVRSVILYTIHAQLVSCVHGTKIIYTCSSRSHTFKGTHSWIITVLLKHSLILPRKYFILSRKCQLAN